MVFEWKSIEMNELGALERLWEIGSGALWGGEREIFEGRMVCESGNLCIFAVGYL